MPHYFVKHFSKKDMAMHQESAQSVPPTLLKPRQHCTRTWLKMEEDPLLRPDLSMWSSSFSPSSSLHPPPPPPQSRLPAAPRAPPQPPSPSPSLSGASATTRLHGPTPTSSASPMPTPTQEVVTPGEEAGKVTETSVHLSTPTVTSPFCGVWGTCMWPTFFVI